jgi:hypothetical protein
MANIPPNEERVRVMITPPIFSVNLLALGHK